MPEEAKTELQRILIGDGVGAPPSHILEAVDDAMAHARLPGLPHSIYEEVWHLAFWMELSLDWIAGRPTPYPEHASGGFPPSRTTSGSSLVVGLGSAAPESWAALKDRFLRGIETAAAIAGDPSRLDALVACPSRSPAEPRVMPVRDQVDGIASHNAYHLGRIVAMRQIVGGWPPPSGGDTW